MNVLILTGKFGMGHYSASQALRTQLQEAIPTADVEVVDLFAYALPDAADTLYKCFDLLVTKGSGLYNIYYKATENLSFRARPPLEELFQDKLLELLEDRRPDAVVATHPLCARLVADYKEEVGSALPLVTCITDLSSHAEWLNPATDCYLVGAPEIGARLRGKGVPADKILVTGIPVKPQFRERGGQKKGGGEGPRRLLIMGGGLGLLPRGEQFYEMLDSMDGVETTLITGHNQKAYEKLRGKYAHIHVLGFTDHVYDYMAAADLMLSKPGGVTLFETIFSGLPILAWEPFLQQERNNARFILNSRIGRVAPKEPKGCIEAIRALLYDDGALEQMRRNMSRMRAQFQVGAVERLLPELAAQARGVCA